MRERKMMVRESYREREREREREMKTSKDPKSIIFHFNSRRKNPKMYFLEANTLETFF